MILNKPSELTHESVHRALLAQCRAKIVLRSSSESTACHLKQSSPDAVRRTSSENSTYTEKKLHIPFTQPKFISKMLQRSRVVYASSSTDVPPDTPPKDRLDGLQTTRDVQDLEFGIPSQRLDNSLGREGGDNAPSIAEAVHSHASDEAQDISGTLQVLHIPLRGKWAGTMTTDPGERARVRLQAQLDRLREEEQAMEDEQRRQADKERRKQEAIERELEDEAQRRALLEEDLKRATAERRRREYIEEAAEERSRRLHELRRRVEKEKRLEEYHKMEQWRKEQLWLQEKARRESEEIKLRSLDERKQRISQVQARLRQHATLNHGWVTIQTTESVVWKRRFFKLNDGKLCLHRDAKVSKREIEEIIQRSDRMRDRQRI